jgi:uncharacterized membrane protein YeaQ/YmgE (transglycosylase-associated protein family)
VSEVASFQRLARRSPTEAGRSAEGTRVAEKACKYGGLNRRYEERRDPMNIIWFLLVGLIAGWLAGTLVKGSGFGVLGDIIVGIIGALLGGFLFGVLGISAGGTLGTIIMATVGAVVLIFILRLIRRA